MINSVVWCMIFVSINYGGEVIKAETATKGIVKEDKGDILLVDFTEYADSQGYLNVTSPIFVKKDLCVKD